MLYQKLISTRYYITNKDEIKELKIPYWLPFSSFNLNTNNFYFLSKTKIFNLTFVNSFFVDNKNLTLEFYKNFNDSNKMMPSVINFNKSDISFLNEYLYLKNSSFIKFFINNMIDIPICFKKSISLKTRSFELPILKFTNFLMKQGKKEKIMRLIFSCFRFFFKNTLNKNLKDSSFFFSWFNLYMFKLNLIHTWTFNNNFYSNFKFEELLHLNYNNIYSNNDKIINTSLFIRNYLYFLLSKVSPIFSFFIYSVDKNIRKYSRGKSGKYTFIWKFIAPYKRTHLAVRWLIKDIKFNQNKSFKGRLNKTFDDLLFAPEKTFSWKSKIFSHNYVFKNFRKSLMISLKTTS